MANGGARPGAGRKPKPLTVLKGMMSAIKKATATEILAQIDELEAWGKKLKSRDEKVALQALMYLTDRRDGKAPQTVNYNDITDHSPERLSELLSSAVTRTHQPIGQA